MNEIITQLAERGAVPVAELPVTVQDLRDRGLVQFSADASVCTLTDAGWREANRLEAEQRKAVFVPVYNIYNRRIVSICVGAAEEEIAVLAPPRTHLLNFIVGDWLVLDPYGNELASDLSTKFWHNTDYTLAIHTKSGQIALAEFEEHESGGLRLILSHDDYHPFESIPKQYLRQCLRELPSMKRPFNLSVNTATLQTFVEHWASYKDLRDNLVVELHIGTNSKTFMRQYLHIWKDMYRLTTNWR